MKSNKIMFAFFTIILFVLFIISYSCSNNNHEDSPIPPCDSTILQGEFEEVF